MMTKGWINEFCFEQSEDLKSKNISNYRQINMTFVHTNFIQYLKYKDKSFDLKLGDSEFNDLENLLLATISRSLWGNDTYYKVLSQEDEYIQKAINQF